MFQVMACSSKIIDNCESCMKETKYICIICGIPVCNVCCFEELNEDTGSSTPLRYIFIHNPPLGIF